MDKNISDLFVRNLNNLMRLNNESQNALAARVGIPQATLSNWNRGRSLPPLDDAIKLAKAYGVSLSALISEKSPTPWIEYRPISDSVRKEIKSIVRDVLRHVPKSPRGHYCVD